MNYLIFLLISSISLGNCSIPDSEVFPGNLLAQLEEETSGYSGIEIKYSDAYEYISQGKYRKAAGLLKEVIDDSVSYWDAYITLGKVYLNVDSLEKTSEILVDAIDKFNELNPDRGGEPEIRKELNLALADTYGRMGEREKAHSLFTDIIKENPDDPASYELYASFLKKQGDLNGAIEYYREAHEMNPSDEETGMQLVRVYFDKEQYRNAAEILQKIENEVIEKAFSARDTVESYQKIDPELIELSIEVLKKSGQAWMELENYEKAIEKYRKILELAPQHVSSIVEIGNAYTKMEKFGEAEKHYKNALELEPENLSIYYQLINLELTRESLSGVKKYLNMGFDIEPDDLILSALNGEYYYRLGSRSMEEEKWNQAIERFEKAISIWSGIISRAESSEWENYAREGINRAQKNIDEAKKVRW